MGGDWQLGFFMADKLIVGPISGGLRTGIEPFNIDNDSFPVLINAYQHRLKIKRKRGTDLLGQLQRWIATTDGSGNRIVTIFVHPIPEGISVFQIGTDIFTDPGGMTPVVTLITNGTGSGTLNLTTGVLTITGSKINTPIVFIPQLPVMGLEELQLSPISDTGEIAFDTTNAYNISTVSPYLITDVSYYKNPSSSGTYVAKTTWTPLRWNGQNYQQFWSTNYENALWVTNGVTVPFSINNVGMQFASASTVPTLTAATFVNPTTMQFTIVGNPLVVGDFVFANEFVGGSGLNFQTGYVTVAGNTFTVVFPNATIQNSAYTVGMLQYLTNNSNATLDCVRFYDGPPTSLTVPPTFQTGFGWVNYMPPLNQLPYSIAGLKPAIYYLAGAKLILPYKDRLVFFGPIVQTSSGNPIYLPDTIVFTQNGTPYYTASYTNKPTATIDTPTSILNEFVALLTPTNLGASPCAMFEDQFGFGGFLSLGLTDRIVSSSFNEDVIITGFTKLQARLVATGNDENPFEFFKVNSELGTSSTFSVVDMDQGVLSRGNRGFIISNQVGASRFDLDIPDQAFQINTNNNGNERVTAIRDFINEWCYFTYPNYEEDGNIFPNETLFYNYRDQSFAIFLENYTTYGTITPTGGDTWATLNIESWADWNSPWNSGDNADGQIQVIAGNQQGYVMFRNDKDTDEEPSLSIQNILANTVTSPNHCLNNQDYIIITGAIGTVSAALNNSIFSIFNVTANDFMLKPSVNIPVLDYKGGGQITRLYVPFIQTKQFPIGWALAKKTRIGPQKYLLSKTSNGQITVQIYLSQDAATPYNQGPIVPTTLSLNDSLIFSQIVYTCPETTNLGLTPANTNLQMLNFPGNAPNAAGTSPSAQIWHRMNTSLIGDTVQLGFTLSDAQMRDVTFSNQTAEIELHGFILDVSPSQDLC